MIMLVGFSAGACAMQARPAGESKAVRRLEIKDGAYYINGDTTAFIRIVDDEVIDLATLNGTITLTVPADTDAELEARTDNGTVTLNNITLTNELITSNVVTGTMGTGTGSIMLNIDNGNITLTGN